MTNFVMCRVHGLMLPGVGFRTASSVLAAVKSAIAKYSATHVTIVGHSLGESAGWVLWFYS